MTNPIDDMSLNPVDIRNNFRRVLQNDAIAASAYHAAEKYCLSHEDSLKAVVVALSMAKERLLKAELQRVQESQAVFRNITR